MRTLRRSMLKFLCPDLDVFDGMGAIVERLNVIVLHAVLSDR